MQLRSHFRCFVFSTAFISLTLTGCSRGPGGGTSISGGKLWRVFQTSPQAAGLTIVGEDLQPLANAKVLIGNEEGHPFPGNFLTTDSQGHLDLPAGWTGAEAVTLEAPGYVRATYFGQEPGTRTYRLRKKTNMATSQFEVKGITQGHTVKDRDGFIDFSLVIPAMTRNDFLNFDINSVISPQIDTIQVLGQDADIPSNIAFPKQKESYFLPVTLEKPGYRVYFGDSGIHRIFAARGRFPFKEVVDQIRNKAPFYNLVNYFSILGGGVRDLEITNGSTQADLAVNEMDFKSKTPVVAPAFRADESMLVVGISHMAEYLLPTDVKILKAGQKRDIAALDAQGSLFYILKKTQDMENSGPGTDRLSAVLLPVGKVNTPEFLPLMADPSLSARGELLVPKMNPLPGVNPVATYALMSVTREVLQGKDRLKVNSSYWEMYGHQWMESMEVPKWPGDQALSGKKHWEVNLIGSQTVSEVDLGPAMINNATHVTHSSVEF